MLAGLMTPADPLLPHLIDESVAAEISASTPTDEPVGSWGLLLIAVAIFAAVFVVLRFIANRKQR
jgi:hypothetical protein